MKITVLGAGSWGTALAMTAEKNGHFVSLWTHDSEEAKTMEESRKCKNLPDIRIPDSIRILSSLEEAVKGAELLLCHSFHLHQRNSLASEALRRKRADFTDRIKGN